MSASPYYRMQFMMCAGTGCMASGSLEVKDALEKELAKEKPARRSSDHHDRMQRLLRNGSHWWWSILTVSFYNQVKPEHAPLIVEEHVLKGRVVEKLLFKEEAAKDRVPLMKDIGFFGLQTIDSAAQPWPYRC